MLTCDSKWQEEPYSPRQWRDPSRVKSVPTNPASSHPDILKMRSFQLLFVVNLTDFGKPPLHGDKSKQSPSVRFWLSNTVPPMKQSFPERQTTDAVGSAGVVVVVVVPPPPPPQPTNDNGICDARHTAATATGFMLILDWRR